MQFIVYTTAPSSGTSHNVLRWGDAPLNDITIQAGAGETAIAAPASWPATPQSPDNGGYTYNSATGTITFFGIPYQDPESAADKIVRQRNSIKEALRDTEWAMLSDAPLTAAEKTAFVNFRAYLRAIPSGSTGWEQATYNFTPPNPPEF